MVESCPLVLDANYFIDVMINFDDSALKLSDLIDEGVYNGIVPTPVLTEVYYNTFELTNKLEKDEKIKKAIGAVKHIVNLDNVTIMSISQDVATQAGIYYQDYNYFKENGKWVRKHYKECLSFVDCCLLAVGKGKNCSVCSAERKFKDVNGVITKSAYELVNMKRK